VREAVLSRYLLTVKQGDRRMDATKMVVAVVAASVLLFVNVYAADCVPGEIIVKTNEPINTNPSSTGEPAIDALNAQYSVYEIERVFDDELLFDGPVSHPRDLWDWSDWLEMVATYEFDTYYVFRYSEPYSEPDVADHYDNLVPVGSAGVNGYAEYALIPNDPMLELYQWNLIRSDLLGCVKMNEAWDYWYLLPSNVQVVVAVIDTGIDPRFGDLTDNLVPGKNVVDPGYPPYNYNNLHGTKVASVICSETNNANAMAGIGLTEDMEVKVMPIKVSEFSGPEDADDAEMAKGILWAAHNGADVINMSFSWSENQQDEGYHDLSTKAMEGAYMLNVVLCAANGNEDGDYNRYPAFNEFVIGVAGCDQDGLRWVSDTTDEGSTYNGRTSCAAPAADLNVPAYWYGETAYRHDASGTSYACAHISAACALTATSYSAPFPPNYVELIRKRIEGCCDDTNGGGWDKQMGNGRINIKKVVLDIINATQGEGRRGNAV
jgi:subtilisin family serine protease